MADPAGTPATPRSPFNPPQGPTVRTGGPGRPLVIGCLAVLVLAGLGLVGGLYYASQSYDRLLGWSLEHIHESVTARVPKDLPAEDRERLEAAFTAARGAVDATRRDPSVASGIQGLMLELSTKIQGSGTLSRQDVRDITGILEKIGQVGKGGAAAAPAGR